MSSVQEEDLQDEFMLDLNDETTLVNQPDSRTVPPYMQYFTSSINQDAVSFLVDMEGNLVVEENENFIQLHPENCNIDDTNKTKLTPPDFQINNSDENGNFLDDEQPVATYMIQNESTPTKVLTRKRICKPSTWKCNILKTAVNTGQEHVTGNKKVIPAKKMGDGCPDDCRFRCHQRVSKEARLEIFKRFWNLGNHMQQWHFVNKHTKVHTPRNRTTDAGEDSRVNWTRNFFFLIDGEEVKVCQKMFLSTLDISSSFVRTATAKYVRSTCLSPDKRGAHSKRNKSINIKCKQSIREHINLFPLVESHYTREKSQRKYLEQGLSLRHMHRLYVAWMNEKKVQRVIEGKQEEKEELIASERAYREIFNLEFNLGFFKPKSDQCDLCNVFKTASSTEKIGLQSQYENHQIQKATARKLKTDDKNEALEKNSTTCYACFDLQKVLNTPKCESGIVYYKRKLAVYNFTVYDGRDHQAYCYVWDETLAKRGANEMASCLLRFFEEKCVNQGQKNKVFKLWSDNCAGQNKNRLLFSMYVFAAAKYGIQITHRYLERGHTQNEGDSVHAVIERKVKNKEIFVPDEWYEHIRNAKVEGNKYKVIEMKQDYILDFRNPLGDQQWNKDVFGNKVMWSKVKEISTDGAKPGEIQLRYNFNSEPLTVNVLRPQMVKRVGRPRKAASYELKPVYTSQLPLKKEKLKDLISMCNELVIPSKYHMFYKGLKSSEKQQQNSAEFFSDVKEDIE